MRGSRAAFHEAAAAPLALRGSTPAARRLAPALALALACAVAGLPRAALAQQPANERPVNEPPASEAPADRQPADQHSANGQPANGQPAGAPAARPAPRPNYALRIDAPAQVRSLIERQTSLGRWRQRADYDPGQFDALYARLRDEIDLILRSLGYFDAEVGIERGPEGVRVAVDAGPRTTVSQVDLRIDGAAGEDSALVRTLHDVWPLPEGSFYSAQAWEDGKRLLVQALRERGFLRARLADSRAAVDVQATSAALELRLESGPHVAFGPITVRGLSRYDRSIVTDLATFREGDPYALDKLQRYETRLRDAGYFTAAYVLPEIGVLDADPTAAEVPITVDVTERKTKRAIYGVGVSSDQGLRLQVGFEHYDLLDRGWRLQSGIIVEGRRQRAFGLVRTPTDASSHYWAFGGRLERQNIEGERIERAVAFAGRGWRSDQLDNFHSLQYQTESDTIETPEGDIVSTRNRALVLGTSWNLRRVDSLLDPHSGYTVTAQLSGAVRGIATDRTFARLYTRAMRFVPMPRDSMLEGGFLVGLLEFGTVLAGSRDGIPSENLFRAGGAQSVRGYAYQSLGVPQGNAIVGGRYLAVMSLEYQHPVIPDWRAAVFYDRGNAADSASGFTTVAGYGLGVRWRSPIGPINVDLAYGQAVHRMRLHFSVGYTF